MAIAERELAAGFVDRGQSEFTRKRRIFRESSVQWEEPAVNQEDLNYALSHFPSTLREYSEQQRNVGIIDRGFDLAELGLEGTEAYWSESRFAWETRRKPYQEQSIKIPEEEKPTMIFLPGMMTWKGIIDATSDQRSTRQSSFLMNSIVTRGPYGSMFNYLEKKGMRVVPIFPKSGFATPDTIDENVEAAAEAIDQVSKTSSGPIVVGGHSMGVPEQWLLAERHPEAAKKVSHFFSGGFSLPVHVNSWVEGTFVMYRNGRDFKMPEEIIEFLGSPESEEIKRKTVSWISEHDRIVGGPSPVRAKIEPVAHSAIFYRTRVLDEIADISKADMAA